METVLNVPTINDEVSDFDTLFAILAEVDNSKSKTIVFDFSSCRFLRQNAVTFLGGLARLIQSNGDTPYFNWDTLRKDVKKNLSKNGFIHTFTHTESYWNWKGNTIPYREDLSEDSKGITNYLLFDWLGRGWVNISPVLKNTIAGTVWEFYANAFEHASSKIGIFSCGQYYHIHKYLKLTVLDFGVGIPYNVRKKFNNWQIPPSSALKWAFSQGTSTRTSGASGGLGLDLLKNFVKVNHGKLDIFSNDGYVLIDSTQEAYFNRSNYFPGTLVNITFQCDESYYRLASEFHDDQPMF